MICLSRSICLLIFYYDILAIRPMKLALILGTLLLCFLAGVSATTLTFYIDQQIEQPLDFVQINAIVKTDGESLEATIEDAAAIIADITQAVELYCQTYAKSKEQCEEIVETSAYSIKTNYELVKKKPVFAGFVVAHEMFIRVKEAPLFGKLADDLLKKGVYKINSLEWKPLQEVDGQEEVVEEGIAQAKTICKKINMELDHIVSVQEVTDFGEDEHQQEEDEQAEAEGEQEQQEEEEEDQEEPPNIKEGVIYYKFVVECHPKKTK